MQNNIVSSDGEKDESQSEFFPGFKFNNRQNKNQKIPEKRLNNFQNPRRIQSPKHVQLL